MIILGINFLQPNGGSHDITTAIFIDGKISCAVSEERLTGVKHSHGNGYPANGIKFCLQNMGLRLSDVDKVCVGNGIRKEKQENVSISQLYSYPLPKFSLKEISPLSRKNPVFYNHEYIHAKTGYFFSGFKKAVCIVLDGAGTDNGIPVSGGIYVIDDGKTEVIKIYPLEASVGHTFAAFTQLCGFRIIDGEGKTMSLAAFGNNFNSELKEKILARISKIFPKYSGIDFIEGGIKHISHQRFHDVLLWKIHDGRLINLGKLFPTELIAWGAQKTLENIINDIVKSTIEVTGIKNVILSGGVFNNMIANMKVKENFEKMNCSVFINPLCGDTGNAVGVILEENYQQTGKYSNYEWPNLSLGPEYDDKQIESAIERQNLTYSKVDKVSTAVDLIDKGKIIGWFQGCAELGPRGLGNRSILSRTDDVKYKNITNSKVKHRESWRPFCPTITKEKSSYYLENPTYAPYMILGFKMKHSDEVPAVLHIDNTTRPQTLERTYNPDYFDVVSGMNGIVLNTSLNLAGDPINTIPDDALLTLKYSQMDALIIGNYLVTR